ncbi:catalase-like [Maniola jurtina]|uniref:catalase-like n=1 Tax=Maniola jurtina TaxID=191418 RepID=UPI001E68967A|nr:catalase-like [Maniola jurtina]
MPWCGVLLTRTYLRINESYEKPEEQKKRKKKERFWQFPPHSNDIEFQKYYNSTCQIDPATCQLYEFGKTHPKPIGIMTTSSGKLIEIRESTAFNSDLFSNQYSIDSITHDDAETIPERLVHAKGSLAFGYFEVTHDVSNYTKADVLNGIGKKTPVSVRVSSALQNLGGNDVAREPKGFAVKFYTKEGNWDLVTLTTPVFIHRDPNIFTTLLHSFKRNPKTNLYDFTMRWDFITKIPASLTGVLYILSDYGIPNGYRKMDTFAIHTFVIINKYGDKHFVRFNFRTEQGVEVLTTEEALIIGGRDPDYYNRDLYNAIENKNYPAWKLEMDVMTLDSIKQIDYNPFDVTRLWKNGTYYTVPIGRLVLNKNPDNFFRTVELSAFHPGNLIPGIPGPMDNLFRARKLSYRGTQVYRLGVNHNNIKINEPLYWKKIYNRDGKPPVRENMKDAPNYYPNSFNGPVSYIDPARPKERFTILESYAVDLETASYFYNDYLCDDGQRQRLVNNIVLSLVPVSPHLQKRAIRLLTLTDQDLGRRVQAELEVAKQIPLPPSLPGIPIPRNCANRNSTEG